MEGGDGKIHYFHRYQRLPTCLQVLLFSWQKREGAYAS